MEYLVKWADYPSIWNSWEVEEDLLDYKELIRMSDSNTKGPSKAQETLLQDDGNDPTANMKVVVFEDEEEKGEGEGKENKEHKEYKEHKENKERQDRGGREKNGNKENARAFTRRQIITSFLDDPPYEISSTSEQQFLIENVMESELEITPVPSDITLVTSSPPSSQTTDKDSTVDRLEELEQKRFVEMMNSHGGAKISLENNLDFKSPPKHFKFISTPLYRQDVPQPDPSFLIGCECKGGDNNGCVQSNCICISQNADSKPVYSSDGTLLKEERGPIYECNSKCSCPLSCPNRVIQRGRQVPLILSRFDGSKGWGVRAENDIPAGTFIDIYLGEVITAKEAGKRFSTAQQSGHLERASYLFDLDFNYENGYESDFTVDAYEYGNVTHFFNHSCEPNLLVHPAFIDSWDPRLHYLAFFTRKPILAGEELCFDYLGQTAATDNNNRPRKKVSSLKCLCGSASCRGFVY